MINRDCDVERYDSFRQMNAHVADIGRFSAVDGHSLDQSELLSKGIITPGLDYSRGAVGSAMSHILLWNAVAETREPISIFEDDAILCKNFEEESNRAVQSLGENWDIILWGYNYDVNLVFDVLPGVSYCVATFNQTLMRLGVGRYRNMPVNTASFRLLKALGICGYAISPQGAERFLDLCLPLKNEKYWYYRTNDTLHNTSLDQVMCHHYEKTDSFCCFPSLCISKNESSISTIINS
ncbi:glycosyltransferase family 25 protein [Acetobacter conturbans]|uniref:glycosyltransferase family 25 protein n=1 Tax=Acetobacter conturbans TaxID=1737472 RepID=UPI0030CB8EA6